MIRVPMIPILFGSLVLAPAGPGVAQNAKPQAINRNAIRALWSAMKRQLTAPDGEEYFRTSLQNAYVPLLIGTLLSATPEEQPHILVLSMSDATTPEVTIRLTDEKLKDSHLNGPLMHGSEVQFEGVPSGFTRAPFMLTFVVLLSPKTKDDRTGRYLNIHAPIPNPAPDHP